MSVKDAREYPERPIVGVGGVVIQEGRALLAKRAGPPLEGQWSIPGGTLEVGETMAEGVRRELREETGLEVRVLELIEVFERIFPDDGTSGQKEGEQRRDGRPQYHFVIIDYLCEAAGGALRAGGDAADVAFAGEDELARYSLTPAATRVVRKAFAMSRARAAK